MRYELLEALFNISIYWLVYLILPFKLSLLRTFYICLKYSYFSMLYFMHF